MFNRVAFSPPKIWMYMVEVQQYKIYIALVVETHIYFDVLLTVHLSIILVINQLNA